MLTEGRIIIFANIHVLVCFIITRPIVIDSILILSVTSVISPHGSELDSATRVHFFLSDHYTTICMQASNNILQDEHPLRDRILVY